MPVTPTGALSLSIWSAVLLASLSIGACSNSKYSGPARAQRGAPRGATSRAVANTARHGGPWRQNYRNDADDDARNDNDTDNLNGSHFDSDEDAAEDNMHPENDKYHDRDDRVLDSWGQPAGQADTHAIATLVKRYYALASKGEGAQACALLPAAYRRSIVADYGQSPGPPYLRGKTCGAVLDKMFEHSRNQAVATYQITEVRVSGNEAYAFLGSRTQPATYVRTLRERGAWKINILLGQYVS